jgi:UDP-N-acetylmuramoylalanine--D-glutamate ligase
MCKVCGIETVVAGNIGLPVLDALGEVDANEATRRRQIFVLELSSFQLETTFTLNADVATILNISEDHLDRYADLGAYAAAKARVYQGAGVRVINRNDALSRTLAPAGAHVSFGLDVPTASSDWGMSEDKQWLMRGGEKLFSVSELQVSGLHNAANALAALALGHTLGLPLAPMLSALAEFKGLAHRVQTVAEIGGVAFIDDSKGTNVGATVAALNGLPQRVVLIVGGEGKGQNFLPLAAAVRDKARSVILIGRDAHVIAAALAGTTVPLHYANDMYDAVRLSMALAEPGDAVLLSPACASFDMFRNYQHRAETFVAAVKGLVH